MRRAPNTARDMRRSRLSRRGVKRRREAAAAQAGLALAGCQGLADPRSRRPSRRCRVLRRARLRGTPRASTAPAAADRSRAGGPSSLASTWCRYASWRATRSGRSAGGRGRPGRRAGRGGAPLRRGRGEPRSRETPASPTNPRCTSGRPDPHVGQGRELSHVGPPGDRLVGGPRRPEHAHHVGQTARAAPRSTAARGGGHHDGVRLLVSAGGRASTTSPTNAARQSSTSSATRRVGRSGQRELARVVEPVAVLLAGPASASSRGGVRPSGDAPRPPPRTPTTCSPTVGPRRRVPGSRDLVAGPLPRDRTRRCAEGPVVSPVAVTRSRPPPRRSRLEFGRSGSLSASRSLPRAASAPVLADHPVGRPEVLGHLDQSQASRGTTTPVGAAQVRSSASSSGSSPAGRRRGTRALLGAGTKPTRSCLGSERISAVTSSSRSPGTSQEKSSALDPVQGGDRDVDGEAVVGRARLEVVAQREGQAASRAATRLG